MKKLKDWAINAAKLFLNWSYKEEFLAFVAGIVVFVLINEKLSALFPEAGFFNLPSQFETIVYVVFKYVLMIVLAWMGLRIVLPPVYNFIRQDIYQKFSDLPDEVKREWALKLIMTFLLCAAIATSKAQTPQLNETRAKLVQLVKSQVGIHEITENDSPEIRQYLAHVGIYRPAYWCVAWVSFDLSKLGVVNPMSAYSPDYAKKKDVIWTPKQQRLQPLAGDVITVYYSKLGRVGHGCFYLSTDKSGYFITGEGNANQKLSRTGGEVCILKRDPQKIFAIARFIK